MTTDDLIDLGHKAGTLFITQFGVASVTTEWMENFAVLVAAAEREACAQACEHQPHWVACVAAIRARNNT